MNEILSLSDPFALKIETLILKSSHSTGQTTMLHKLLEKQTKGGKREVYFIGKNNCSLLVLLFPFYLSFSNYRPQNPLLCENT